MDSNATLAFSIVMPTFRRPHTLPRAVASVLAQNYPRWELIVANNDPGPQVELPADPRIRVVQHAERTSVAADYIHSYSRPQAEAQPQADR